MKKQLILISIMMSQIHSRCDEGCLRCEPSTNTCKFCDITLGYKTVHGKCLKVDIPHCAIHNFEGICLHCEKGFYLDIYANRCLENMKTGIKENCEEFSGDNECVQCASDFELNLRNECIQVAEKIQNCYLYKADGVCAVCLQGFILGVEMKSCTEIPSTQNCGGYTQLKCMECKSEYQMNENNYIYELFNFSNKRNIRLLEQKFVLDNGNLPAKPFNTCQRLNMPNCLVHLTFNECVTCEPNYYLFQKQCYPYPKERILNCLHYSALAVCVQCEEGYFLKSETECQEVQTVANCEEYDSSANVSKCAKCIQGFYLIDQNTCSKRTTESDINSCQELYIDQEKCKKCDSGFRKTDDEKVCLGIIKFCKKYEESNSSTISHICNTCNERYFYDDEKKACVEGSVKNCLIFQRTNDTCSVCENRYYLSGGQCKTHDDLVYCQQYSNLQKNLCEVCGNKTMRFERVNTCLPVQEIDFCEKYANQTECGLCMDGFQITNDKQCVQIPGSEFCLQKDQNNNCTKCLNNYILDLGKCVPSLNNVSRYCDNTNVDGMISYNQLRCLQCKENSVPIDYRDSYLCYENDYLEDFKNLQQIDHCLQYKWVVDKYLCMSCSKDYFLDKSSNSCVQECQGSTKRIQVIQNYDSQGDSNFDSFLVTGFNECGEEIANCKLAAPDLKQNHIDITYSCIECKENTLSVITLQENHILYKPPLFGDEYIFSPVSFSPSKTCRNQQDQQLLGKVQNDKVPYCELYSQFGEFGLGCIKCQHGYSGEIADMIHKCQIYSSLTECNKCEQGYYPQTSFRCESVTPVAHCVEYENDTQQGKCKRCENEFFLSQNSACEKRQQTVENCQDYEINSENCKTCETNYYLNQNGECAKKTFKCKKHDQNNDECIECEDEYYLYKKTCHEGQVQECKVYIKDKANICEICNNGFHLNENECVETTSLQNCDTYSQEFGICQVCPKNHLLFSFQNRCTAVVQVEHCQVYLHKKSCKRCTTGKMPVNYGQRCVDIPNDYNCQEYGDLKPNQSQTDNNCLKCDQGFLLLEGQCKKWLDLVHDKCLADKGYDANDLFAQEKKCKYCENTAEAIDLNPIGMCLEKDLVQNLESPYTPIENCYRYSELEHPLTGEFLSTCQQCESGYMIYVDKEDYSTQCITLDECKALTPDQGKYFAPVIIKTKVENGDDPTAAYSEIEIETGMQCLQLTGTDQNCYLAPVMNSNSVQALNGIQYKCVECYENFISIVGNGKNLTNVKRTAKNGPNDYTVVLKECINPFDSNYDLKGQTNAMGIIQNCAYYYHFSTGNVIGCLSCQKGYTGVVRKLGSQADRTIPGYLENCQETVSDCANNITTNSIIPNYTQFGAVDSYMFLNYDILFSGCQQCDAGFTGVAYITSHANYGSPGATAPYNFEGIYGVASWNTAGAAPTNDTPEEEVGISFSCSKNGNTVHGITLDIFQNCAKAILNITNGKASPAMITDAQDDLTTWEMICVACDPGYKAERNENSPDVVVACTEIQNCDGSSNWLGQCSSCSNGFTFEYNTTDNFIDYTSCIAQQVDFCYAETSSGLCKMCDKNYKLQDDNTCAKIIPSYCQEYQYLQKTEIKTQADEIFYRGLYGCQQCNDASLQPVLQGSNFIQSVGFSPIHKVCTVKEPLTTVVDPQIPNCKAQKYTANLEADYLDNPPNKLPLDCIECENGFILTLDGQCVADTNLSNCKMAKNTSSSYCVECIDNTFVSVAGTCEPKNNFANCEELADSSFKTGALCLKCVNGYYLATTLILDEARTTCIEYTGTEILNCDQFDNTTGRLYCTQCETGYALLILEGDEVNGENGYNRRCIDISSAQTAENFLNNCSTFDLDKQSNGILECTACNANFFLEPRKDVFNGCLEIDHTNNCSEYSIDDQLGRTYLNVTYKLNYLPRKSSLYCTKCSPDYYLKLENHTCVQRTRKANDADPNVLTDYDNKCQEMDLYTDFCKECIENYFLSNDKTKCNPSPAIESQGGTVLNCTKMESCRANIRYQGLQHHIESLTSCHKCKKADEIPFLALGWGQNVDDFTKLQSYNLSSLSGASGGHSTFCSKNDASLLQIGGTINFPANCGIGILNTDHENNNKDASESNSQNANANKTTAFCTACKPGYRRKVANLSNWIAYECEIIQNCQESYSFNYCSQCKKGYAFQYDDNQKVVNYDTCVTIPNTNLECFSFNDVTSKCMYCSKGSYLNKDGICEKINPPACEAGQFGFRNIYSLKNLNTGLYLNHQGTGCNKCQNKFSAIYISDNHFVCTESSYHKNTTLPNTTKYIQKCKHYTWSNNLLKCSQCESGYVPIKSTGICQIDTQIKNCKIADSSTQCNVCMDEYVLVNRVCEKKNIDNCVDYVYDESSNQQTCSDCGPGYYLSANTCNIGNVPNCYLYETETICNKCVEGFDLVKRTDGVSYCYPIDQSLNCKTFNQENFQKGRLQCAECSTNHFVIDTNVNNFYQTHCMRFFEVANCVRYDIRGAVADSGFTCQECTDNFYLDNNVCKLRTVELKMCQQYDLNADKCSKCISGYFINSEGNSCEVYPVGTKNCRKYQRRNDELICQGCVTKFYLDQGICKPVLTEDEIENCLFYVAPKICDVCNENHMLIDNTCQVIQAQNCLTVENVNACASCPNGFGFKETNNVKNCEQQTVLNCVDFQQDEPYLCTTCEQNFYPVEGVCTQIAEEKRILNCLVNADETTCVKCTSETALSLDRTKCISTSVVSRNIDENCQYTFVNQDVMCNSCKPGFVFKDGECIQCQVENPERCYNCDPLNLKKCLLCNPGFYHNIHGSCGDPAEIVREEDPDKPGKPSDKPNPNNPQNPTDQNPADGDGKQEGVQKLKNIIWSFGLFLLMGL